MELELSGWRVASALRNAAAVDVRLDGPEEVGFKLEERYRVSRQGLLFEMDPEIDADRRVQECWSPLIGIAIKIAVAEEAGKLVVKFDDGSLLECGPGEMYEAWSYFGPGRMQVLSLPGGRITVVEPDDHARNE